MCEWNKTTPGMLQKSTLHNVSFIWVFDHGVCFYKTKTKQKTKTCTPANVIRCSSVLFKSGQLHCTLLDNFSTQIAFNTNTFLTMSCSTLSNCIVVVLLIWKPGGLKTYTNMPYICKKPVNRFVWPIASRIHSDSKFHSEHRAGLGEKRALGFIEEWLKVTYF